MAYHVEFVGPVVDYLAAVVGLSDDHRAAIIDGVVAELARDADLFLARRPIAHESLCFLYDYAHVAEPTLYHFDFVVDASSAEMGVVRVVYVECTSEPLP